MNNIHTVTKLPKKMLRLMKLLVYCADPTGGTWGETGVGGEERFANLANKLF